MLSSGIPTTFAEFTDKKGDIRKVAILTWSSNYFSDSGYGDRRFYPLLTGHPTPLASPPPKQSACPCPSPPFSVPFFRKVQEALNLRLAEIGNDPNTGAIRYHFDL